MVARSPVPRLTDIVEAIERIHDVLENISPGREIFQQTAKVALSRYDAETASP
jgi:hypothetical protein